MSRLPISRLTIKSLGFKGDMFNNLLAGIVA